MSQSSGADGREKGVEAFVDKGPPCFYGYCDGQQIPPSVASLSVPTNPKFKARQKSSDTLGPTCEQPNQSLCQRCRCITLARLRQEEGLEHHTTWNSLEVCDQSGKCALCVLIWGCAAVEAVEKLCRVYIKAPSLAGEEFSMCRSSVESIWLYQRPP
jgi:hypothetical protein